MSKGYMYILRCCDNSYYTGSTKDIALRLQQHQNGEGANYTKKRLPVELVYYEEFQRVDEAFYREKQVQGWSRKKKEALIERMPQRLNELAKCLNETSHTNFNKGGFGSAQPPEGSAQPPPRKKEQSPQKRCLSEVEGRATYNSYKDSGVEWIGEIPSNWEKSRIRMVGDLYGGLTGKKGSDFNDEDNPSNKPFVPFTNIFNNTYISKDHFQYANIEEDENQNRVLKNDLFFLMSSESYEDLGKCSILLDDVEELYLNSFCKGYRIKNSKVYPLFLNYQLLGSLHKEMISVEGNGFTRINLRQDRLLDIPVFIPPIQEQKQIVSFLDTKTSLIDSLIEKTHRKIELLKEKRTSLINETVTKGLNPNVEMKDSGVEWIGEIPSHYEMGKLKHLCDENLRSLSSSTDPNYELKYIEISDVNSEGEIGKPTSYIFSESPSRCRRIVQKGDVIVSTVRTYLKSIGLIEKEVENLICSTGFSVLTPKGNIHLKYLFYLLRTEWFISMVISKSEGVSYPSIQSEKLKNIDVLFCDFDEQQQIVEYLNEQTGLIDKTISNEERRIELLKEYRQSLISEVVTGKRKVTNE